LEEYQRKDRPLNILVVHGSARNTTKSAALEESNSKLLLRTGLQIIKDEPDIKIEEVELRNYFIEPCNSCLSTCSGLCGTPCNCFVMDGMQDLYPMVLRADVMLFSTPVNQSMISTRLKAFVDRLISLDGGLFVAPDQYAPKDENWKRKCMALAASGKIAYNPRMAGKVCAYFITSKDAKNPLNLGGEYESLVPPSLWSCFQDYGCLHAEPWYVIGATNPEEDYQFDKANLSENTKAHRRAQKVVLAAIELGKKIHQEGYTMPVDRINRT
jgi:multimeric flavodoxin WrbA